MTKFIYRFRWLIIAFSAAIVLASALLIPGMKIDPEIRNYIPASIDSRVETDRIEEKFGVQDIVMILFSDSSVITYDNLVQIRNIDRSLSKIGGVSSRMSPFTVRSIKSQDGFMIADRVIMEVTEDPDQLRLLGEDLKNNRFARDIVVSSDLTTASITATVNNSESEGTTIAAIDSVIASHPGNTTILKGGLPYIRQYLLKDVARDAAVLVPLALIIMLVVLKLNLRKWRYVMMPFAVVVLSTLFSLALLPLLGWKMSIITMLVPVILIAVANNYGIYLTARYQELSIENRDASRIDRVKSVLSSLKMPVLFSGLTTVAGILGLLTHSIIPARQVGVLAAAGVILALLLSLFLIPAFILAGGSSAETEEKKKNNSRIFNVILERLSDMIIKHSGKILLVSVAAIAVISSGAVFLKINTNQETYFSKNHPVRLASDLINTKFGGSQTVSVMIDGDITDPLVMDGIDRLTLELGNEKGVGSVFSISQAIREMSKAIYTVGEDGYDRIPESREAIAQMFELYYMSGDQDDFRQLINSDNSSAHLLIRLSEPENHVIRNLKDRIGVLTESFPGEVTTGGYAIIMADFARSIIKGQVVSLLFAIGTVLLLLTIIFRSLKGGLISIIPLVASICIMFGFMGYTGIALDAATALLSSLMIGVGVDFTIQFIWSFNLKLKSGMEYNEALGAAMKTIGRSIIINALGVISGFSALMISGFLSIRFFGYLVTLSIFSCLFGALVIIPAILVRYRPGFIGFNTKLLNNKTHEKKNDSVVVTTAAFAGNITTA